MKTLIFGKDGQLGKAFQELLFDRGGEVIFAGRQDCDLSNSKSVQDFMNQIKPGRIINTAAYTAVDKAEQEKELAFAVNTLALKSIAEYCAAHQKVLLHFSTDYVFDGNKTTPYLESDICNPLSTYGKSKYAGELAVLEAFSNQAKVQKATFYILRTSWVYGEGNNFIRTILRLAKERSELKVVADQNGVPTNTKWLAELSLKLLEQGDVLSGIYHAVPSGQTSWFELASFSIECARNLGVEFKLDLNRLYPMPASDYPLPAKRPMNSCLSISKLIAAMPSCKSMLTEDWKIQVKSYIQDLHQKRLI
jgi:dTDP-4-dehydrorhamnose reductase